MNTNKEKELIVEIYKLVKELKEEKQKAPIPENIQLFIDFLKSDEGISFIRVISYVISLGLLHHKITGNDDYFDLLDGIKYRLNNL